MNGIGFAFADFDSLGRRQSEDGTGASVDTSLTLVGTDVDGPLPDAYGLMERLANSRQAAECLVTHWLRFGLARDTRGDAPAVAKILERAGPEPALRSLILEVVLSDAFRLRRAP